MSFLIQQASYILNQSSSMSKAEVLNLFGGFCPVSGSPVYPSPSRVWQDIPVQRAGGGPNDLVSGNVYVCCWPCVCDLMEFVKTDKVDIQTIGGNQTLNALVIGECHNMLSSSEIFFMLSVMKPIYVCRQPLRPS